MYKEQGTLYRVLFSVPERDLQDLTLNSLITVKSKFLAILLVEVDLFHLIVIEFEPPKMFSINGVFFFVKSRMRL